MERKSRKETAKPKAGEPIFIVKSAARRGGLDYLHISLLVLVAILVILAFALSAFKPGPVLENCPYGIINGTCAQVQQNSSLVLAAVGKVLAGYSSANSSLSLLAYYSLINRSKVSYVPATGGWVVVVPYVDPLLNGSILNSTFILNRNLSLAGTYLSAIGPNKLSKDRTVAFGTVSIAGRYACNYSGIKPVYFITDPYAPGAISDLRNSLNVSAMYANSINVSYYFVFTGYALSQYGKYGENATQNLGRYLTCASKQRDHFGQFVSNLSNVYSGVPVTKYLLDQIVMGSRMNQTLFTACLSTSGSEIDSSTQLAAFYNISFVPIYIVNCEYSSLPQTVTAAVNYTIG